MDEKLKITKKDLISCLVVTANRPQLLKRAVLCYNRQSYENKELVVVDDGAMDLTNVLSTVPESELKYLKLEPDSTRTLGDLRNMTLDLASGSYMAQWDDDDWYHTERLTMQYEALRGGYDACCLSATLMHIDDVEMGKHPFTGWLRGGVPGTIMHVSSSLLRYPHERRGEDTSYLKHWMNRRYTKLDPKLKYLFIRCFHGNNTWGLDHFTRRIRNSPISLVEYIWCKYVKNNVYAHSNFKLCSKSKEALRQFDNDSDFAGLEAR